MKKYTYGIIFVEREASETWEVVASCYQDAQAELHYRMCKQGFPFWRRLELVSIEVL